MKNKIKWLKRPAHFALTLLVIAILGIGTTIAFFTDIEAAVNSITFGKIEIETKEEISGLTKKNIGVTSTGSSECYVRMRVDVPTVTYRYTDGDGAEKDGFATVTLPDGSEKSAAEWIQSVDSMSVKVERSQGGSGSAEWVLEEDGYWYLSVTLNKGDYAPFLSKVEYPGLWKKDHVVDPLPDGLTMDMLTIPIVSEAVQSEGIDVGGASGAEAAYDAFQTISNQ